MQNRTSQKGAEEAVGGTTNVKTLSEGDADCPWEEHQEPTGMLCHSDKSRTWMPLLTEWTASRG